MANKDSLLESGVSKGSIEKNSPENTGCADKQPNEGDVGGMLGQTLATGEKEEKPIECLARPSGKEDCNPNVSAQHDNRDTFNSGDETTDTSFYNDPLQTQQRQYRDILTSLYFNDYSNDAKERLRFKRESRNALMIGTMIMVLLFSLILVCGIAVCIVFFRDDYSLILSTVLPICGTFITLIVSLLKIMVEYVFPKDEDQSFASIIQTTLKNDIDAKSIDANLYNRKSER